MSIKNREFHLKAWSGDSKPTGAEVFDDFRKAEAWIEKLLMGDHTHGEILAMEFGTFLMGMYYEAIDTVNHGRYVCAGESPDDAHRHATSLAAEKNAQRVFTPEQLYKLEPIRVTHSIGQFLRVNLQNEDLLSLVRDDYHAQERAEAQKRIHIKVLGSKCPDGRRTWYLATVWFDDEPVMVINRSGRDDDEYHNEWITSLQVYGDMIAFLRKFAREVPPYGFSLVAPDKVIPEMTEFYGSHLGAIYDFVEHGEIPR